MNQLPGNVEKVSDIVKVLNGGIEFYKDGIQKVAAQHTRAMFERMLEEKQEAVLALNPYLTAPDDYLDSDWAVALRNRYTDILEHVESSNTRVCLEQLKEVEEKVQHIIDIALENELPQHYASELRRIRSRMQQCHDEMHALQNVSV